MGNNIFKSEASNQYIHEINDLICYIIMLYSDENKIYRAAINNAEFAAKAYIAAYSVKKAADNAHNAIKAAEEAANDAATETAKKAVNKTANTATAYITANNNFLDKVKYKVKYYFKSQI